MATLDISPAQPRATSLDNIDNAWTDFTPAVGAGSGSFTTVSASGRYRLIGAKTCQVQLKVVITDTGTAGSYVTATLPFAVHNDTAFAANNSNNVGVAARATAAGNTVYLLRYDGTYPGGNGVNLYLAGAFEVN